MAARPYLFGRTKTICSARVFDPCSGLNNAEIPDIERIFAYNQFANFYNRLNMNKKARPHLEGMGKKAMFYPWAMGRPEGTVYTDINFQRIKSLIMPLWFSK